MNKAELIEALSGRLGDRKSATAALDAVLAEIQNAVTKGDKVSITGFGVFEKRVRAARTARNPRTGESVKVKKTSVPAFRPGAGFKELVAAGKLPKATSAAKKAAAAPAKKAATIKAAPPRPLRSRPRRQGCSGQGRSGQGRSGQDRSGQDHEGRQGDDRDQEGRSGQEGREGDGDRPALHRHGPGDGREGSRHQGDRHQRHCRQGNPHQVDSRVAPVAGARLNAAGAPTTTVSAPFVCRASDLFQGEHVFVPREHVQASTSTDRRAPWPVPAY